MLELKSIESFYGKIQALNGVTLEVPEGGIVAVLGANGAGKSTTLKTISGLIQPLRGQILFQGQSIHKREPHQIVRMGICQVPEGRDIFMGLTVQENLKMGARGLMSNPKLMLLDEPSLGLAPLMVEEIFRIISEINKEGVTILLVEQNANMALQTAQYGYVMETGTVALHDTAENLIRNDYVRKVYLGVS
jgi:branched-chain amino acid transport system ATP-binding protein